MRNANIVKRVGCHTFRNCFPRQLLEGAEEIAAIQEPLGHEEVTITAMHSPVLSKGGRRVRSPIDVL